MVDGQDGQLCELAEFGRNGARKLVGIKFPVERMESE